MTLQNTESYNHLVTAQFTTNLCQINPHPLESHSMLKRIFKFLWRLILALGAVGLLGILLPRLITTLSYLIFRTSRIVFVDREHEDRFLDRGEPIIFAGLHEGMMMLPYHFRDRTGGVVMVSRSQIGRAHV